MIPDVKSLVAALPISHLQFGLKSRELGHFCIRLLQNHLLQEGALVGDKLLFGTRRIDCRLNLEVLGTLITHALFRRIDRVQRLQNSGLWIITLLTVHRCHLLLHQLQDRFPSNFVPCSHSRRLHRRQHAATIFIVGGSFVI